MLIFNLITIFILGLCFGSFITMASYRFSLDKISINDFIFRNSFCPNCNKRLKMKHLLPIFSWIFYKGKCGFCEQKISLRYPLIEVITAIVFTSIFITFDYEITSKLVIVLMMVVILLIMIIVDLESYFIPDFTQVLLAIVIIFYHIALPDKNGITYYLGSAIVYFAFGFIIHLAFLFITHKKGIGEDDLKFFAVAGLALGIDDLMIFMILSGVIGSIFGLLWMKLKKDDTFPFAPAITSSFLICLIYDIKYIEFFGYLLYLFQKFITKTAY